MILVRHLMNRKLLTIRETSSVGLAKTEMKLARVRHFPVLDRRGALVGVISNRDVLRAVGDSPVGKSVPVRAIMTKRMQTIRADEPAHRAARLMRTRKIGSVLVVDEKASLVGIITESDFLEVAERALLGKGLATWRY